MFFLDPRTARAAWTVLVFLIVGGLAYVLRHFVLLVAFSLLFAYLIFPLVRLAQRWLPLGRRRTGAIAVVYAALLLALTGTGLLVGPRLTREVKSLAEKLPEMSAQLKTGELVGTVLGRRGWEAGQVREVEAYVRAHASEIVGYAQRAMAGLLTWLAGAWTIVLVPVFAFFILKDAEAFTGAVANLLEKRRHRQLWRDIGNDLHVLLGEYMRALIVLALITFVVWAAVFFIAGVPYAIVLAAIGGALEFLPVLGPLVAGVLVITVSLFSGYPHPWLLAGFVLAWRGIQDYASGPLIMGRGVAIPAALVIFGVVAGGEIGGPTGMFLSVPVIAGLRIVWRHVHEFQRSQAEVVRLDADDTRASRAQESVR